MNRYVVWVGWMSGRIYCDSFISLNKIGTYTRTMALMEFYE